MTLISSPTKNNAHVALEPSPPVDLDAKEEGVENKGVDSPTEAKESGWGVKSSTGTSSGPKEMLK